MYSQTILETNLKNFSFISFFCSLDNFIFSFSENSKFISYEGTNVSGTQARALCDTVRNHNNAHLTDPSQQVVVMNSTAVGVTTAPEENVEVSTITTVKTALRAGKTYTVDFGYDKKTGYIVAVGIYESTSK